MPNKKQSPEDQLKNSLMELKEKVTNEVKYKVALSLGINDRTIERYLDGKVGSLVFGKAILAELQKELQVPA